MESILNAGRKEGFRSEGAFAIIYYYIARCLGISFCYFTLYYYHTVSRGWLVKYLSFKKIDVVANQSLYGDISF